MPDYEIRLLAADGYVAEVHVTNLAEDEAAIAHARALMDKAHSGFEIRQGMTLIWPRKA
jgi:hypothetical protein